jgi:hypothetical protein
MTTKTLRPLYELGATIESENRGKPWFAYAKPYVEALCTISTTADNYGADTGKSIVLYALSNLSSWRGETAKAVKAELKLHLAN